MTYDMTRVLVPMLLAADAIVLGSPVFFNNVSAQLKAFMDRTWSIKGKLRNKIGGAVVVGRKDGAEGAITAIHSFFLKHEMIPVNRDVHGMTFASGEITEDAEAMESAKKLCKRIMELDRLQKRGLYRRHQRQAGPVFNGVVAEVKITRGGRLRAYDKMNGRELCPPYAETPLEATSKPVLDGEDRRYFWNNATL